MTHNHGGVITHLEPDILECKVKWTLKSITMNKASGGYGIQAELFQVLKNDAVKMLHSLCQQIWKTQQWPQDSFPSGLIVKNPPAMQDLQVVWFQFLGREGPLEEGTTTHCSILAWIIP